MSSEDLQSPINCPDTWRLVTLKSICTKIGSGATPTGGQAVYLANRIKFALVRSQNVLDRAFAEAGLAFISDEQANALKGVHLQTNDILLNITGDGITFGRACLVPEKVLPACVNQHVSIIRVDPAEASAGYLISYLTHPTVKSYIESFNAGGSRRAITKAHIESFVVPLPPLQDQISISKILSVFDDRITLLRETNTTLEAIAQALFKSWFVDFDPVHAKMEGRAPEGMDQDTAALFPDSFEESELGNVPKGWRVQKFEDFIDRQSVGKKFDQKTAVATGQVPILDQGKSGVIGFHNEEPGIKATLEKPVVVFANHTCYMRLICFDFSTIQNVLPFIGKGVDTVWAFYATKDRVKFSEYKGHWPDFAIEKAVVPSVEFTYVFRRILDPLVASIRNNELQIQNLYALRDTLLPRLISGQLRLPEAQAIAESV
jgi:type I restriction enzyme S subunit